MTAVPMPAPGALQGLGGILKGLGAIFAGKTLSDAIDKTRDKTREADCSETPDETQCNQCKLTEGFIAPAKGRRNIDKNNIINYHYQAYIANLHAGPEVFGFCRSGHSSLLSDSDFSIARSIGRAIKGEPSLAPENLNILEWHFGGIEFDGFWRGQCTVVDAKGCYAKFFDDEGGMQWGFKPKFIDTWPVEMQGQNGVVQPTQPQGKLQWHFMEAKMCAIAKRMVGMDSSICFHTAFAIEPTQA